MSLSPTAALPRLISDGPYVGLTHYTEEYADLFFGREAERKMIIGNLRAARLTLLYAESGVGKSSLLRAGVVPRLRELAERSMAEQGSAQYVPFVFSSWGADPVDRVVDSLDEAIQPFLREDSRVELPHGQLDGAIRVAAAALDSTLLVILDQFEEYFPYHAEERPGETFVDQLARCVNSSDLRANFLISIRQDMYGRLGDLFKGRIPNVYGNYVRLQYLDRKAAHDAIEKPIELFNLVHENGEPIEVHRELVEAVLDQVARGKIVIGEAGPDGTDGRPDGQPSRFVETPYLQLVMKRLWEEEMARGSRVLRAETLESLGGAETIIRTHLDEAMTDLPESQQDAAAAAFRYIVTPSGTKVALSVADLAEYAKVSKAELEQVVKRLSGDVRILRPVATPGKADGLRYEIFHDALASSIVDWRRRHERRREELEAAQRLDQERAEKEQAQREALEAQQREAAERRRARIFRGLTILCVAALLVAAGAVAFALVKKSDADKQARRAQSTVIVERAADALSRRSIGPGAAALASLEAYRLSPSFDAATGVWKPLQENVGLPRILGGHTQPVSSVAFSPRSSMVAAGSQDGSIRLWDGNGHELGGPLYATSRGRVDSSNVNGVAFSPDGHKLAAAREDGAVNLWAVPSRHKPRLLATITASENRFLWTNAVAFGMGDRLLAAAGSGSGSHDVGLRLWDVSDTRHPRALARPKLSPETEFLGLAFGPKGRLLATASDVGIRLWDVSSRRQRSLGPPVAEGYFSTVALSPNGRTLAGTDFQRISVWNLARDQREQKPRHWKDLLGSTSPGQALAFAARGSVLVSSGQDDNVTAWDVRSGRVFGPPRPLVGAAGVAVSPDGKTIASGGADGRVKLWSLDEKGALATILGGGSGEKQSIYDLALGAGGQVAAASGSGGTVIWSLDRALPAPRGAKPLTSIPSRHGALAVDYHGSVLAASDGHSFTLWDTGAGCASMPREPCPLAGRDLGRRAPNIGTLAFAPSGKVLASGDKTGHVKLWDVSRRRTIKPLSEAPGRGRVTVKLAFSPRDPILAAADDDGRIRLWSVRDPRHPAVLGKPVTGHQGAGVSSLAFSPDGQTLATGGRDQNIALWHVDAARRRITELGKPLSGTTNAISALAFSPDGATLAAGDADGDVELWDLRTRRPVGSSLAGRHLGEFSETPTGAREGEAPIDALRFDPRGNLLLSAGLGNPIVAWKSPLWSRDKAELGTGTCRLARRNLEADEWSELFAGTPLAHRRHKTCPSFPLP